jgi:hypothetical protein
MPEKIERSTDWAAAETVAAKLAEQEKQAWPGVDEAEKAARLTALRTLLAQKAAAYVALVSEAARAAYAEGKDGNAERERLLLMAKNAPLLKDLVAASFDDALKRVTEAQTQAAQAAEAQTKAALLAAEQTKAERDAKAKAQEEAARKRVQALAAATQRLDELNAAIQKGQLSDCAEGVALLGGFTLDDLSDADLKAKWQSVRGAYVKLIEQTMGQKEPLGQRAQRLKSAAGVLGHAAAGTLFASDIAALRKALEQQKSVCVLRLVNRSGTAVQVTCREVKERLSLADGEKRDLELPVSGELLEEPIAVDGGSRFRPHSETVLLPCSGGVEWVIGALEPAAVAVPPVLPAVTSAVPPVAKPPAVLPVPPAVTQQTANPPPVTLQPTNRVPEKPPAVPAAVSSAAFEIRVNPRNAVVSVDGRSVTAGSVLAVTPNENHKVTVECVGYKSVQQYYKAKPGETRKIDILLEKEIKKSFFGL